MLGFTFTYLVSVLLPSGLLSQVSGGEMGKPFPAGSVLGFALEGLASYVFIAGVALAAFASAALIFRSTLGRMLLVMREDDVVARSLGVNTNAFKIGLSAIVGGYGALGGVLASQATSYVAPPQFDVSLAILLLAMALVGGARYLAGGFVGTVLLWIVPDHARSEAGRSRSHRRRRPARLPGALSGRHLASVRGLGAPCRGRPMELSVNALTVKFGALMALSDVSICARIGQIVALIGPNGAGKTTLLNAVSGLIDPHSGTRGDRRCRRNAPVDLGARSARHGSYVPACPVDG